VKGKRWAREQEKKLQELIKAKLSLERIAKELGLSLEAVRMKVRRLGLEVVDQTNLQWSTTTCALPTELLTVEQVLLSLARAVRALEQPGLDKDEILRLRSLVQGCKIYQDKFAEYIDYRHVEEDLLDLRKEIACLKKSQSA